MNADSDAAAEIPRRWRLPADLHGAGKLTLPGVRPTRYSPRGDMLIVLGRSLTIFEGDAPSQDST